MKRDKKLAADPDKREAFLQRQKGYQRTYLLKKKKVGAAAGEASVGGRSSSLSESASPPILKLDVDERNDEGNQERSPRTAGGQIKRNNDVIHVPEISSKNQCQKEPTLASAETTEYQMEGNIYEILIPEESNNSDDNFLYVPFSDWSDTFELEGDISTRNDRDTKRAANFAPLSTINQELSHALGALSPNPADVGLPIETPADIDWNDQVKKRAANVDPERPFLTEPVEKMPEAKRVCISLNFNTNRDARSQKLLWMINLLRLQWRCEEDRRCEVVKIPCTRPLILNHISNLNSINKLNR
jgi:hypothetical protein